MQLGRSLSWYSRDVVSHGCLLGQAQPAPRATKTLRFMPGTYQLHLLVLMFYFDFSCEYTFKCICVGLCENIMYGKLCSCGPQQRQTQLLPSLTTNSTLPGPRSSHSTDPVPCECGKECREERQERALPEWTMNPFTNSFPLIHATPQRIGYHYPHIIAEESQGGSL